MNKLLMAQNLRRECHIGGSNTLNTPTTTQNQVGQLLQVVDLIDLAYQIIQTEHDDWLFMRKNFSFNTISGTQEYSAASLATDFDYFETLLHFRIFNGVYQVVGGEEVTAGDETVTVSGESLTASAEAANQLLSEGYLFEIPWEDFYTHYKVGGARYQTGLPMYYSINPEGNIELFPIPSGEFTVMGQYVRTPHVMTDDAHVPIFKERYHWAIVWKALELYGSYNEEPNRESKGEEQYDRIYTKMCHRELPRFDVGGPLA